MLMFSFCMCFCTEAKKQRKKKSLTGESIFISLSLYSTLLTNELNFKLIPDKSAFAMS